MIQHLQHFLQNISKCVKVMVKVSSTDCLCVVLMTSAELELVETKSGCAADEQNELSFFPADENLQTA